MATREELVQALAAADAAGATDDARFLADQLAAMDAANANSPENIKRDFENQSIPQKIGTAATDVLTLANNGLLLGWGDQYRAGMKSLFGLDEGRGFEGELENQRAISDAARVRAGSAGTAAEVGGSMMTGTGASRAGLSVMDAVADASKPLWQRLLAASGAGAVEGAAYGGIQAAGEGDDVASGIQMGGGLGAALGPVAESLSSLISVGGNKIPAPTKDQLVAEKNAGYKRLETEGVNINPEAVGRLNDMIDASTVSHPSGARRHAHPATYGEVDALLDYSPSRQAPRRTATRTRTSSDGNTDVTTDRTVNGRVKPTRRVETTRVGRGDVEATREVRNMAPDEGMSLYDLDQHRQAVRESTRTDPRERIFGDRMINDIDDFANRLTPDDVTANPGVNVKDAVEDLENTRATAHRVFKLNEMGDLVKKAERRADTAAGTPQGTQLRSKAASVLENRMKTDGYTPDELQMLEELAHGSKSANFWRGLGEKTSGPGSMMAAGAAGGLVGAPFGLQNSGLGVMAGAAGMRAISDLAKRQAEKASRKQAQELLDTVARGGKRATKTPKQSVPGLRGDINRLLVLLGLEGPEAE